MHQIRIFFCLKEFRTPRNENWMLLAWLFLLFFGYFPLECFAVAVSNDQSEWCTRTKKRFTREITELMHQFNPVATKMLLCYCTFSIEGCELGNSFFITCYKPQTLEAKSYWFIDSILPNFRRIQNLLAKIRLMQYKFTFCANVYLKSHSSKLPFPQCTGIF